MVTGRYELDLDTAVLRPDQLSDHEKRIATDIEDRLREVAKLPRKEEISEEFGPHRYAQADDRRQRVLLLDGGRGTGKTSFLVTLIDRWNRAACNQEREEWPSVPNPPDYVRVLRILDFDPVPSSMPLLAAIVHSWRPLVQYYDNQLSRSSDFRDDYDDRKQLMDDWHALFRVAAAGWSELPRAKGLLEEVLDREEQVRDWQYFREHWQWFVDRVVDVGQRIRTADRLNRSPAFVVVIDDVDLQVARIRELLPALRLLAHDNVFFLVAADLVHLSAMLTLEFYGQQVHLASATSHDLVHAYGDRWAQELARASVEKVFPIRNRWRLEKLSLTEMLRYPQPDPIGEPCSSKTIHGVLDRVTADLSNRDSWGADRAGATTAGDAAQALADAAEAADLSLKVASYRSAQQLWQTVRDAFDSTGELSFSHRSAELLGRLVAPGDDLQTLVRSEEDGRESASADSPPASGTRFAIRITTRGELSPCISRGRRIGVMPMT